MPIQRPNISGNAGTASKLQTARTIGGVAFDGSANINLPGVNQAGSQNTSGNAASATKLANDTGSAPSYSCRAWVNFNGVGTVEIRASGNVSSITDFGTGQYGINLTNAMPDANYSVAISTSDAGGGGASSMYAYVGDLTSARTASSFRITSLVSNGSSFFDSQYMNAAVFR